MPIAHRNKLVVPALLAFVVVGVTSGCPGEESAEQECYDRLTEQACKVRNTYACQWETQSKTCGPDCPVHADKTSCNADPACDWANDACRMSLS
jgi:hypothetical protein